MPDNIRSTRSYTRQYALVAVGGVIGSVCRGALALAIPHHDGWPWATFWTNLSGSFVLGIVLALFRAVPNRASVAEWRPFLVTGVLGGFTTFSTYLVETHRLVETQPLLAITYLIGSVVAGLVAVSVGLVVGNALARNRAKVNVK